MPPYYLLVASSPPWKSAGFSLVTHDVRSPEQFSSLLKKLEERGGGVEGRSKESRNCYQTFVVWPGRLMEEVVGSETEGKGEFVERKSYWPHFNGEHPPFSISSSQWSLYVHEVV